MLLLKLLWSEKHMLLLLEKKKKKKSYQMSMQIKCELWGRLCILLCILWLFWLYMLLKNHVTAFGCNLHLSLNCLPCTLNAKPVRMLKCNEECIFIDLSFIQKHHLMFSAPQAAGDLSCLKDILSLVACWSLAFCFIRYVFLALVSNSKRLLKSIFYHKLVHLLLSAQVTG